MKPTELFDVREFVPQEVYKQFGEKSWWFVSDNIVKAHTFLHVFFNEYYKAKDATIEKVVIVCNNYHSEELIKACGTTFSNRGLRTVRYINDQVAKGVKTATLSQHVGGSTNAEDVNVVIFYKSGRVMVVSSDFIHDVIMANQVKFMEAGITTLESKRITKGWTHLDCRFTGLDHLFIVEP